METPLRKVYEESMTYVLYTHEPAQQYQFAMASVRSALQLASCVILECCTSEALEVQDSQLPELASRFLRPNDSHPELIITEGIALLKNCGLSLAPNWSSGAKLRKRVIDWVAYRNGHDGHGVVSAANVSEAMTWLPTLLTDVLDEFDALGLALLDGDRVGYRVRPNGNAKVSEIWSMPSGRPIVLRSIRQNGEYWNLAYQTVDSLHSTEGSFSVSQGAGFFHSWILPRESISSTLCRLTVSTNGGRLH